MKKIFTFRFMLLLCALVVGCSNVWADEYELYSGTITEGDYVIVYDGVAMKNTVSSSRLDYQSVTISNNKISNPGAAIVWHIAASGNYWTIYNANVNKYAASTGVKSKAQLLESGTDDMSLWTVSGTSTYEFVNKKNAANNVNKNLRYNSGYGFACYATGTGGALSLYKKVEAAGEATTVTIDDSGLTNTNKFFGTAAGTLTAAVIVTSGSAAVDGATVTWSSGDEDVATIDEDGVVTLVGEGSTTITASYAGETGVYKSSYAEYVLNVTDESPFNYTLWSEDFGNYSEGDKPSGGTYSYVCKDGGTNTQIYEASMAGGTSPELLVNRNGGTFQATIPLDNITGKLKLRFKSNAYAITVSTSTDGISISGDYLFNTAGEHTVTFTGIIPSMTSIVIKFAAGSSNVRIDDITLKGAIPGDNNHELTEDFTIPTGTTFAITSEFIIPDGITLTVNGTLENNDPAKLIIEDGGQLIHTSAVNATLQKEVSAYSDATGAGNTDGWYFIASPLDGFATSNLALSTADLYSFDEEEGMWWNAKNEESGSHPFTTLSINQGYLYANSAVQTLEFAGNMQATNKEITIKLNKKAADGRAGQGVNLVGNPFTRSLNFGEVTIGGSDLTSYYIVEGGTEIEPVTFNASTPIKPGRGFMVEASADQEALVLNPSAKGRATVEPAYISIEAGNESFMDRAYVQIGEGNTLRKMTINNNVSHVYVQQAEGNYAAATIEAAEGVIPVAFDAAADGTYTITVKAKGLETEYLHLIDNMTGADVDLLVNPSYTFNARNNDYESRFKLVFSSNNTDEAEAQSDFAFISNGNLIVAGTGTLQIVDMMGRTIASYSTSDLISTSDLAQGVYVLRLVNGDNVKTQKIVVK